MAKKRVYVPGDCAVFWKLADANGFLSNMYAAPVKVNGRHFLGSEVIYQMARFPLNPDIQEEIATAATNMGAKSVARKYDTWTREDWLQVRVNIMRWALRVKFACLHKEFTAALLATGGKPIVERSSKDDFWGAMVQPDGMLMGYNVLGRLLMELRQTMLSTNYSDLLIALPPASGLQFFGEDVREVTEFR